MTVILPGGLGQLYGGKPVVAVDSPGTGIASFNSSTTIITSMIVPSANANAILLWIFVNTSTDVTTALQPITWGSPGTGNTFTQIGKFLDTSSEQFFYGLANPPTSGNQGVWFNGSPPAGFIAGMSFTGVKAFQNFNQVVVASGTAVNVPVTSGAGHMVAGGFYSPNGTGTVNQTQWFVSGGYGLQGSYGPGAASVTLSSTGAASGRQVGVGVDISN